VDSVTVFLDQDSLLYYAAFTEIKMSLADSLGLGPLEDTLVKPSWMTDTISLRPLIGYRHRLLNATVAHGTLWLSLENMSDVTDTVRATLANLVNARGDTLVLGGVLAGHARVDTVYDLAGYVIRLPNSVPQFVEMRLYSADGAEVHAYVRTDRISFHWYSGVLDDLVLEFPASGQGVERPPEEWESVHPTRVEAYVRVVDGVRGAVADANLTLATYQEGHFLDAADLIINNLELDQDSAVISGLSHLMAVYPDSVSSSGRLTVNGTVENVEPADTIRLQIEGRAHLAFTLDPVHSPGEVERIDNKDLKDVQSGSVRIRIWNRLPVGARAFLVVDRDSARVLEHSGAQVDTIADIEIPAPVIVNGRAQDEVCRELSVTLDDSLLELFRNPPFFVRTDLTLPGSNGDTLVAHAADYVKVQAVASLTYRIDTGDQE
jgi:hypothetical protein